MLQHIDIVASGLCKCAWAGTRDIVLACYRVAEGREGMTAVAARVAALRCFSKKLTPVRLEGPTCACGQATLHNLALRSTAGFEHRESQPWLDSKLDIGDSAARKAIQVLKVGVRT